MEIIKKYPNLSAEKLDTVFKQVEPLFIENIANMLDSKVELIGDDLDEMEKTLGKFRKISDDMNLNEKERQELKLDFIENLLELGIYHVNPEKGELPAEQAASTTAVKGSISPVPTTTPINKGGVK